MRVVWRMSFALLWLAMPMLASSGQEAQPAEEAGSAFAIYIAQPGDSLYGIAAQFDTSIDALIAANNLGEVREVYQGQSLLVPRRESAYFEQYIVQPGDTLFKIALRFRTSVGILQGLNDLAPGDLIHADLILLVPKDRHDDLAVHTVSAEDSLFSISRRYNTEVALLKSLNGIREERELRVGESLFVPRVDETRFVVYEIEPGDSLYNISRLYNTSVGQLRALNGIGSSLDLEVGGSILVPRIDATLFATVRVKTGESLFSLSRRHDVSVAALQELNRLADPNAIRVGQQLLVPRLENAVLDVHVAREGESLAWLAERYGTTVQLLQTLNAIDDPRLIQLDARLLVPKASGLAAKPGFGAGIHVFIDSENAEALAEQAQQLGVDWVKIDVPWAQIEPEQGQYDYSALDDTVAEMALADIRILLNVFDAPAWSRLSYTETLNSRMRQYGGPPADLGDFARFLANLATRYAGIVSAYEIWKSPNLLKYWTVPVYERAPALTADGDWGMPEAVALGAEHYLPLLKIGYETLRSLDPDALVISAGLAPVGLSDGYNSIETGAFLSEMLAGGAAQFSDAIGAVFSASAVPPTLSCCDKPPGVESHYESFLQYFPELMRFYADVLALHDLAGTPIVVTQVGWGTREGANIAIPSSGFEWLNYTSEAEQALYVTQAYQIVQGMDSVSAMFLYNLNGCAAGDEEACFFSLVDAAGARRPAFAAFEALLN